MLNGSGSQVGRLVFFDDVRIFPEAASFESYVYDLQTRRLIAKLDENNFASLFGYSPDGRVEVIRHETVRGVLAESESRLHIRERP